MVIPGIQQFYGGRGVPSSALGGTGDRECRRSTSLPLMLQRLRAETLQFRQNPSFSLFSVTLRRIYSCCCTLNKLDASTNGNYAIYRNPRALSSALATLGTLQPRALGFLNRVVPLVSASNYYILAILTHQAKSNCCNKTT